MGISNYMGLVRSRIRVFGFLCRRLSEQNIPGAPREWMGVSVSIRVQLSDCSY